VPSTLASGRAPFIRRTRPRQDERVADSLRTLLRTPGDGTVKVVEQGTGTPVVFLHSGVGSAGEWRGVFARWPEGYRLVAVDAYRGGTGPGVPGRRTLDDYADQVHAVAAHVGEPLHLVGFSWGGATALHVAATAPALLASVAVVEPEAYSLLTAADEPAYTTIRDLRDRWREHVRAVDWFAAAGEFIDFYNGPGSFAAWPAARREEFVEEQRGRGDLWDVLFDAPVSAASLASVILPVHVVEGSASSVVDRAICAAVLSNVPRAHGSVIGGAGHMMPLTHPAELTRVLVQRLA
jgi:pimeloyl-ACP methyl ester carboxylesterase